MNHKQALQDYDRLREISGGFPHDSNCFFEITCGDLLKAPSTKKATVALIELIEMYAHRGGPAGDSLMNNAEAVEIFSRHGLVNE